MGLADTPCALVERRAHHMALVRKVWPHENSGGYMSRELKYCISHRELHEATTAWLRQRLPLHYPHVSRIVQGAPVDGIENQIEITGPLEVTFNQEVIWEK